MEGLRAQRRREGRSRAAKTSGIGLRASRVGNVPRASRADNGLWASRVGTRLRALSGRDRLTGGGRGVVKRQRPAGDIQAGGTGLWASRAARRAW
jgi:hypothetical protein